MVNINLRSLILYMSYSIYIYRKNTRTHTYMWYFLIIIQTFIHISLSDIKYDMELMFVA